MTDTPCVICTRREPGNGATVCGHCLGRVDGDLARIAELTRLAGGWLTATTAHSDGAARPVPGSRPPLNVAALDACLGNDVMPVLESWCRLIREDASLAPYGAATEAEAVTVGSLVTWLRSWLLWASERVEFPMEDYAGEVRDLRWSLERLDPDRDKPGLRIPCPTDHPEADGRSCGYRLAVNRDTFADDIHCPRCDTTWTGNRLLLVALNDPGVTVWAYPDDIRDAFGIPDRTLREWAAKGHVSRLGSRYDVGAAFRRKISA